MEKLSLTDYESLTEEKRSELRSEIQSKLDALNGIINPDVLKGEVVETPEMIEEKMQEYLSTLRKTKQEMQEDANLMGGGGGEVTRAEFQSLKTSLASLGGGGLGETEVTSLINTTVINNFGLDPLDSNLAEPTRDIKVRFRLSTTPTILNQSEVSSVTSSGSGQQIKYVVNFATPFSSGDDYVTMLTLDQEGTDRTTSLIPPVSATSRTAIVIQQNAGSVTVAVENAETADNQDEGVLNVQIFDF
jgi:hypothetical protein